MKVKKDGIDPLNHVRRQTWNGAYILNTWSNLIITRDCVSVVVVLSYKPPIHHSIIGVRSRRVTT